MITPLANAVAEWIEPGAHLHFASLPFRSNAAVREIARQFRGRDPGFTVSATGFHTTLHLLPRLGLGRRYIASFFGDNHPTPRPNRLYSRLDAAGQLEVWSLLSLVTAFRAGALDLPFGVSRSLVGSELGQELELAGRVRFARDPMGSGESLALVAPLRPDVTFVHAHLADTEGNLVIAPPSCEGAWSALGARVGVIATAERIVHPGELARLTHMMPIPRHRVKAVCPAPFGAHPQPLVAPHGVGLPSYFDDPLDYARWRTLATDDAVLQRFVEQVLDADDPEAAYRSWVGPDRMQRLRYSPVQGLREPPSDAARALIRRAAHHIAHRIEEGGFRVVLAGIGASYTACLQARDLLRSKGLDVAILVEIGMYDVQARADEDPFLLSAQNIATARRLTGTEDILGAAICGADNRALGVVGAAEVDRTGALNSVRLPNGRFLVGSGGANDICARADEVVVLTQAQRLVDRVAHATSPGSRVRSVVTPDAVLWRADAGSPWTPNRSEVTPEGVAFITSTRGAS